MMKVKFKKLFIVLFSSFSLLLLGIQIGLISYQLNLDKVLNIYNLIKTNFSGNIDKSLLSKKLLEGLNDKYSYYVDKEKYSEILNEDKTPTLTFKEIQPEIGYLKISRFSEKSVSEFNETTETLRQKNYQKLIIDLRNNLGGNTESALYINKQFIKDGVLLKEVFKSGKEDITYADSELVVFPDTEVVILVNKETSSAAEHFAAAFQDNKRAKIIGEPTFGKSSIGEYFELKDGSAIHLTIGHWLRPNGESVEGKGVQPDILVQDVVDDKTDAILTKALDVI